MALNDAELCYEAIRARDRLQEAHIEVDRARSRYQETVRRVHDAGGSLREIAEMLEISHQRVHQLLSEKACSFCDARQADVAKLISGPGVCICDGCLLLALRAVASGQDASDSRTTIEVPVASPNLVCSFCRKKAKRVGPMAQHGEMRICGSCLMLCTEIVSS